jgi:hypothetical protein
MNQQLVPKAAEQLAEAVVFDGTPNAMMVMD